MIQRLVILGFLKRNPCCGYDIRKFIERELSIFSQLNTTSIYYPLRKMEGEGLVRKKEIKENHLKKYIYEITPKGEREFLRLCKSALSSQRRPFMEIDIPLYFLSFLKKEEILPFLRLHLRFLNRAHKWLKERKKEFRNLPKSIQLIIEHHIKLVKAEKIFLKEMLELVRNKT
ncbi:MAG: PadR family transcriptional regulator [Candidatus Omnitrophica bacterium]|nr:PadR family transcriptional regulator [Candidatus Omnitrophota bacterium]